MQVQGRERKRRPERKRDGQTDVDARERERTCVRKRKRKKKRGGGGECENLHAIHGRNSALGRDGVVVRHEAEAFALLRHLVLEHGCRQDGPEGRKALPHSPTHRNPHAHKEREKARARASERDLSAAVPPDGVADLRISEGDFGSLVLRATLEGQGTHLVDFGIAPADGDVVNEEVAARWARLVLLRASSRHSHHPCPTYSFVITQHVPYSTPSPSCPLHI